MKMDLESFLALEKQRLAEERKHLYEQHNNLNSFATLHASNASTTTDNKKSTPSQKNGDNNLNKKTKDWINEQFNRETEDDALVTAEVHRKKKSKSQDDMEQWVSDTFYSYFPGFSNEYQKRQNELQKRQRENQENLIRHQMLNPSKNRKKKTFNMDTLNTNSARSNNSSVTSYGNTGGGSHGATNRTDLEIINVNNPNYVPSKHYGQTVRTDSARDRLLQDLRHTNLANLLNSSADDAKEANRLQAEIEAAHKKEYQRELMQQIEEKRRTIKLLRDKEKEQEEVLTRRLQEQLKTMKLEEQLEKERIKAVKVRFDAEQNRLNREHLLAQLEVDSQRLLDSNLKEIGNERVNVSNNETNKENINRQDNKVYKYFSNSEKHEYNYRNKSLTLPTEIDLEFDQSEFGKIERECFHLSEKICPMCDEPLKELENFCLRCQNKISFRIKSPTVEINNSQQTCPTKSKYSEEENITTCKKEKEKSFFLVCIRCEKLYSWCRACTSKTDVCKACQNKRNLCMSCRKTLCSFCLEEVACGKDTESLHINDSADLKNEKFKEAESVNDMSFHDVPFHDNLNSNNNDNKSSNEATITPLYESLNNLNVKHPPYSINIEKNSIFHPDNKLFPLVLTNEDKHLKLSKEHEISIDDQNQVVESEEKHIERLRRDTDKRLFRYLKNYGDLAYQTRGTQTTPTSSGRRDIVLQGEHSLSIPLLREMPKMTRLETNKLKENSKELQDLQRRWDVPAVQKISISSVSPKVVTQVGAIRKQLQADRLFSESCDS